jgi:hypothetical protein
MAHSALFSARSAFKSLPSADYDTASQIEETKMTDFEAQVLADLNVLKSQMQQVMGIGQPGRLNQLEGRVGLAEESIQKIKGVVAAVGMGLTLIQIAIGFLNSHRH